MLNSIKVKNGKLWLRKLEVEKLSNMSNIKSIRTLTKDLKKDKFFKSKSEAIRPHDIYF